MFFHCISFFNFVHKHCSEFNHFIFGKKDIDEWNILSLKNNNIVKKSKIVKKSQKLKMKIFKFLFLLKIKTMVLSSLKETFYCCIKSFCDIGCTFIHFKLMSLGLADWGTVPQSRYNYDAINQVERKKFEKKSSLRS